MQEQFRGGGGQNRAKNIFGRDCKFKFLRLV